MQFYSSLRARGTAAYVAWFLALGCTGGQAGSQAAPSGAVDHQSHPSGERQASPLAALSSEQRARFDAAQRAFAGQQYAEAFDGFRQLLPELQVGSPAYVFTAEFASEAAIHKGDRAFALRMLQPIEQADADDWRATALLARAYAEDGDGPGRDREIARLAALHQRAATPQIAGLGQFELERIALPKGFMRVWYSLTPWGPYHVYAYGRVYDTAGQQVLRLTLESDDADQPSFAKTHPELAARGEREFSLDGYGPDARTADGHIIQSHYTYAFFDGQPSYETVRKEMMEAADGERKPSSGRFGPVQNAPGPSANAPGVKN